MQRREINFTVETAPGEPMVPLVAARAFAHSMRTSVVEDWAAHIDELIADCEEMRRAEHAAKPVDGKAQERARIEKQIGDLQRELREIAA